MGSGAIPVGVAAAASALLLFAAHPGSPGTIVLAALATLPLFLVGLSLSLFHGIATAAAATIAILFAVGTAPAAYYAIVNALPAALLMWQADRHPDQPGRLVITLCGFAALPIIAAAIAFSGEPAGLQGVIQQQIDGFLAGGTRPEAVPETEWRAIGEAFAGVLPAMAATFWALLITINASLAQGVLRRFGKARLPSPDIAEIRLPRWLPAILAATLAGSFLGGGIGYVATNLVSVATLPFFFAGLGIMHAVLRRSGGGRFWIVGVYMLLLVFGWPAVVLMLIGLVDLIFDFRGRGGPRNPPSSGT